MSNAERVKKLQASEHKIKIPIGVIGSNNPAPDLYLIAEELGIVIAQLGLITICGGRAGVMEAVCKGVKKAGGVSIGVLPENNLDNVNEFVTIPLATGIGLARNAMIAASSLCLIAVGGGYGTLSEIAYGLQFGKKVLTIGCDLNVSNTIACENIGEIKEKLCQIIIEQVN